MVGVMGPLDPIAAIRMTRNHGTVLKAVQQFRGRKYDYTPRNQFEEQDALLPGRDGRADSKPGIDVGDQVLHHPHGRAEGRAQGAHPRERGLHNILPPQLRDPVAAAPGLGNPNRGDPDAGVNNPLEDRAAFSANM